MLECVRELWVGSNILIKKYPIGPTSLVSPCLRKNNPNGTISRREQSSQQKGHQKNIVHCGDHAILCTVIRSNNASSINEILRVQSRPTRDTEEKSRILLDYTATDLNSVLHYKAKNMVIHLDSDAEYLTMP